MSWGTSTAQTGAPSGVRFRDGDGARRIPFRYEQMHVIIPVTIRDSVTVDMMLDTGFGSRGAILLDPALGTRLGLQYVGQVPLGGAGEKGPLVANLAGGVDLSLPGVAFPDQNLLVVGDGEPYRNFPGRGIIGRTLFDCVVEIDYDSSFVHLYEEDSYRPEPSMRALEMGFTYDIPVIDGLLSVDGPGGVPVKLIADNGAGTLLLFAFSGSPVSLPAATVAGTDRLLSKGFNGVSKGSTGRIVELRLGEFSLRHPVAVFPDEATWGAASVLGQNGMVGNEVLRRFTAVFDYGRRLLYLAPGERFHEPFEWPMTGFLFEVSPEGVLEITEVIPASPSTENDIRPGDRVLEVNGNRPGAMPYQEIWDTFTREGARVALVIERGPERLGRTLTLRRLI
jgi:hypothetical protein